MVVGQTNGSLEFGFVPQQVVEDLQDIGNWKSRATAIDLLHRTLREVYDRSQIVPGLSRFTAFLMVLVADPNFKIAISSMAILGDLIIKLGRDIEPQLRSIVQGLVEKFADTKVLVRGANVAVLQKLMTAVTPRPVVELLLHGLEHPSWRVREEVLNTVTLALLSHPCDSLEVGRTFNALVDGLSDPKDKVKAVALEALAVMNNRCGASELAGMLQRAGLPEAVRARVKHRLANPALPSVSPQGELTFPLDSRDVALSDDVMGSHHQQGNGRSTTSLDEARRTAAAGPTSTSIGGAALTKLPWEVSNPRPRLRPGAGSTPSDPSPDPQLGPACSTSCRPESGSASGGRAGGGGGNGSSSSDLGMGYGGANSSDGGVHYRSTGATGPGQEGGSMWSSSQLQAGVRKSRSDVPLGSGSALPDTPSKSVLNWESPLSRRNNSKLALSSFSSAPPLGQMPSLPSAAGLLRAVKNTPWMAMQGPEPEVGTSRSAELLDHISPLSPSRGGYQSIFRSQPDAHGAASEGGAGRLGALPLRGLSSGGSPSSAGVSGCDRSPVHSQASPAPTSTDNPGLSLWLQTNMDSEGSARMETYSPSKSEMLGKLKRRQQEKRVTTAQIGSVRQDYSDSPTASSTGSPGIVPSDILRDFFPDVGRGHWDDNSVGGGRARSSSTSFFEPAVPALRPSVAGGLFNSVLSVFTGGSKAHTTAANSQHYTEDTQPMSRAGRPGNFSAGRLQRGSASAAPSSDPLDMANRQRPPRDPANNAGQVSAANTSSTNSNARRPDLERLRIHSAELGSHSFTAMSSGSSSSTGGGLLSPPQVPQRSSASVTTIPPTLAGLSSLTPSTPGTGGGGSLWGTEYKAASNVNELTSDQLMPVADPEKCMRTTLVTLVTANNAGRMDLDWQGQHEALNDARRLVRHHPEVVRAQLHEFVRAAIPAVDMLRSTTSKNSLLLFQELFQSLGRAVDKELEEIVPVLLKKSGEVSTAGRENFLVGEADRTLQVMCRTCSEPRCIAALLACAQHKSPTVRAKVASHLDGILESSTARAALQGGAPTLDRLFKSAAAFLDEGALEARTYGKRIIWNIKSLIGKSEFDRLTMTITPLSTQKKVVETVENCNGPPPPPNRGGALGARAGSRQLNATPGAFEDLGALDRARQASLSAPVGPGFGRSTSRGSSDGADSRPANGVTPDRRRAGTGRSRTADVGDIPVPSSPQRLLRSNSSTRLRAHPAGGMSGGLSAGSGGEPLGTSVVEALNKALLQLSAKDFRERNDALRAMDALVPCLRTAPEATVVSVLDGLGGRLSDGNSKVNCQALEILAHLFSVLRDRVAPGLNTLVPALTSNLGSTNDKVRTEAITTTDCLIESVDPALLVQNFSHCASNGHLRGKPILVEKLQAITALLYPQRPQLVVKYAVPAALSLLKDTKGDVKASSMQLLTTLARLMGEGLMEHAISLPSPLQQRVADAIAAARR